MRSRFELFLKIAGAAAALLVFGAACGQSADNTSPSPSAGSPAPSASATNKADPAAAYKELRMGYHHMFDTGDALAGAIAKQKNLGDIHAGASDTRLALGRLLGEHAYLAVFAMQKGLDGAADFEKLAGALDNNTADLGGVIESVYGKEAANAFLKQWRDHIRMFVDFTVATAKDDKAGRDKALQELSQYKKSFSEFMSGATGAPATAVAAALQEHVDQLTKTLDLYKAKSYDEAYKEARMAYHHMYGTGDALAGAIATQKKLGDIHAGASDTRITLDRLLGEHAILAAFAMQKGAEGKPDFNQIASALDANTADLGGVIESVYGKDAGNAFLKQWRDHIRMFVDFTVATAKNDKTGRDKALEELSQYKKSFSEFMSGATGAPASAVADALQAHVAQLTKTLDLYLGRSHEGSMSS